MSRVRLLASAVTLAVVAGLAGSVSRGGQGDEGFAEFLREKGIDRAGRGPLAEATAWDDAAQRAAVRVLLRLAAPEELFERWRAAAVGFDAADTAVADRLVTVRGRAVRVSPQPLTAEQRQLAADRTHFDVVRIVTTAGDAVDVLMLKAPARWSRGRDIDEPAEVVGLPVSAGVGPRPADWPAGPPVAVLAAPGAAWYPPTTLSGLGMDYALFDTVTDGGRLQPGDTLAFAAMLAAAGRMPDAPAGKPTDIVPLIDPSKRWFATHRGDEVVIAGDVRRAIRIDVDKELRGRAGTDHYWELFVFVPTPPLNVDGNMQDSFPVVCCVRELPPGMPTGDRISEWVVVSGFAFKRYGYPLADAVIGDEVRKGERRETPLVIGRRAVWQARPSSAATSNILFAVFATLAALVALALAWGTLSMRRDARIAEAKARAELPEKLSLPGEGD